MISMLEESYKLYIYIYACYYYFWRIIFNNELNIHVYNRFLHPLTDGIQRNLLGRPPSPHHEGGHKNCPPLFWRNQRESFLSAWWFDKLTCALLLCCAVGGHPMGEGKGGVSTIHSQ